MNDAASHHVCGDPFDERAQQPCDVTEPLGELSAVKIEPAARVDLDLTIQRKMIAELGDRDVGEEAGVHHAARDRQLRHRRLNHGLAFAA